MASRRAERLRRRNARKELQESFDNQMALITEEKDEDMSKLCAAHKLRWDNIHRTVQLMRNAMPIGSAEEQEIEKKGLDLRIAEFQESCDYEMHEIWLRYEANRLGLEIERGRRVKYFEQTGVDDAGERKWEYV
jgi:hypothetical protein